MMTAKFSKDEMAQESPSMAKSLDIVIGKLEDWQYSSSF